MVRFARATQRDYCQTVFVFSNHDDALPRWLKTADFREELRGMMREAVKLEKEFISDCLPVNSVGLTIEEFTTYIDYIADRRLEGVGLEALNPAISNPLPWLAEMMDVKKETNFFEQRVTDYSKSSTLVTVAEDEY